MKSGTIQPDLDKQRPAIGIAGWGTFVTSGAIMVVVMDAQATPEQIERVCQEVRELGYQPHPLTGPTRTSVCVTGNDGPVVQGSRLALLPGVRELIRITKPYKLVGRDFRPFDTIVNVAGVEIGGPSVVMIAGPCTIESREQLFNTTQAVVAEGAQIVRGGAFKPRTSPYSFQGLGEKGLQYLAEARAEFGVPVVTEVMEAEQVELVAQYADMLQIGARNMQNFGLLRKVGRVTRKPILLKRGFGTTVRDLLLSAEYILAEGNPNVVLCERGIRTFEDHSRFTLDLSAIPVLKELTHLPVIVDPSHAVGLAHRVLPMARAALAAGADGLIVEVHPDPSQAVCDAQQALTVSSFAEMMVQLERIAAAMDRPLMGRATVPVT